MEEQFDIGLRSNTPLIFGEYISGVVTAAPITAGVETLARLASSLLATVLPSYYLCFPVAVH